MIALAIIVVAELVAILTLVAFLARFVAGSASREAALLVELAGATRGAAAMTERENRGEREMLLRAVLAKSAPEFGALERIVTGTGTPRSSSSTQMSPEQYQEYVNTQLRQMGLPATSVPGVPEGL